MQHVRAQASAGARAGRSFFNTRRRRRRECSAARRWRRVGLQAIRSPSTRGVVARALTAERPLKRPVLIQSAVRIRNAMPKGFASPKRAPRAVDRHLCWQRLGSRRAVGLAISHRSKTSSTEARDRRTSVSPLADGRTSSQSLLALP